MSSLTSLKTGELRFLLIGVSLLILSPICEPAESLKQNGILKQALQTIERDDRDAGPAGMAEEACETGFSGVVFTDPGYACVTAYELALKEKRFEQAMHYAVTGCEKHSQANSCRNAGGLPLWMGMRKIPVPLSFNSELKRIAQFACFSGARLMTFHGFDTTGRECSFLARQFILVQDPEYKTAFEPAALRFFKAIFDPPRAARLYSASCSQLDNMDACERMREFSAGLLRASNDTRPKLADFHATIERADRELGEQSETNKRLNAALSRD